MECLYEIQLDVPLGIRKGQLRMRIDESHLEGELDVLGNKESFAGTINAEGVICIQGTLTSIIRRTPYKGIGNISGKGIQMLICTQDDCYKLTGNQIHKEETIDEEIL